MSLFEKTKKLALGTVQFGLKYGISNTSGKTDTDEVGKILNTASENGIDTIDTARDYGSSEETLGKFNLDNYHIVSKFYEAKDNASLRNCLSETLKNLKQNSLYGYIAHTPSVLFQYPELWKILQELKTEGLVKKIGASLYTPDEVDKLLENKMIPDLVQFPYNILDNRFESYFPILKSHGTEIHTRSAFLQGIFFMNTKNLDPYFNDIVPLLNELDSKFKDVSSKAGYLLNYCVSNPNIDKVVIGVNSSEQLSANIESLKASADTDFKINLKIPEDILLPSNWPKN